MPRIRVLVADMPRLQRDMITEVLAVQGGVEVVVSDASAREMWEAVEFSRAQVVVLGRDDPRVARTLLELVPRLVVLTVADPALVAWRYGLNPYRERLGDVTPAALTAGIQPRPQLPAWWTD